MPERFVSLSAPSSDEVSLLELADRLLNRGVVLSGEATISVAGVDLIYLGLNVVLTAAENLKRKPEDSAAAAPRDHDV
jgi:gas vesicle structural protein